ncbi:hypothetical protein BY996DRAFT_6408512 [Phakopsora pachyrhizi]|nr:hypothetical protein BY996DRAFT_6408512 [Phakopsora pachyrhizi]
MTSINKLKTFASKNYNNKYLKTNAKNTEFLEFPLSKPRKSLGTAKHMADQFFEAKSRQLRSCTQLLAKLQNSREEIQNSIDKEVFNNLQSLLAQLNDYTDKYLNELKRHLGEKHWKKLELGFIKSHLNPSFNMEINRPMVNLNTVNDFNQILKSIENAQSFNPEWLKILSMDSKEKNVAFYFTEKIFVLHILSYCQKYFGTIKEDQLMMQKVDYFKRIVELYRKQLEMYEELVDSGNLSRIILSEKFSVMNHILALKPSEIEKSFPVDVVLIGDSKFEFLKTRNTLGEHWKSRYTNQCSILETAQKYIQDHHYLIQININGMTFNLRSKPTLSEQFYDEFFSLSKVYTELTKYL